MANFKNGPIKLIESLYSDLKSRTGGVLWDQSLNQIDRWMSVSTVSLDALFFSP
jgi:hypothetical protein